MMFPTIRTLSDLQPFVETNKQIRIKPDEATGHLVVSYQVQDEDTFTGEHEAYERECRGITFYPDGKIASRTLHKFFNIGQRDDVQPETLRWQEVTRVMDKRDGSMVTPVLLSPTSSEFRFKTKKTFTSKEALNANEFVAVNEAYRAWILRILTCDLTPTFEMTSPKFPIVLMYAKDELTLLHVRENVTGRYLTEQEIQQLAPPFPIVENVKHKFLCDGLPQNLVSWAKLKAYAETAEKVEGVVIQFGQEMIKLKTLWYCNLHHSVTFTRWRDVARSVLADQSDDLKSAFAMTGRDIAPIIKVEREIAAKIEQNKMLVEAAVAVGHAANMDAKAMAINLKGHELFGLIMRAFRNQEINWMDWYAKNHTDDWSLEVIGDDA